MKKAIDQTVRDLKREVNKKVLKVPGIEQKVLDATSNEPWGPHGSLLADIAHASKNHNDYQMTMIILWKRINDTGKNWRHVYKGLTVLEYLVANGSERVIDDIREHTYQISTLSDFQYFDSSGRDQGSNVRKKSQSLVLLVNDKERVHEVRQKAAANRDKFRNTSLSGGMYKPSSYSSSGGYGDRYNDDNRSEGRYGSRGDDRHSDYGRDSEDRYGRDSYRDGDYQGRSRSFDDFTYATQSRSSDRDRDRGYDDDANSSARGSGARADEQQDVRRFERKFSEQNLGSPPSYEEAVTYAQSPIHSDRGGETSAVSAPKAASPPPTNTASPNQATTIHFASPSPTKQEVETFDEFDPRGSFSAAPISNSAEMNLIDSLSDSLAIVLSTPITASSEADTFTNSASGPTYSETSLGMNKSFEDPFGDSPFKAIQSSNSTVPTQNPVFPVISTNQNIDILADIFPPSGPTPLPPSQSSFSAPIPQTLKPNPNVPVAQSGPSLQFSTGVGPTSSMNSMANNAAWMGQLAVVPQPSKDKFETKSTVWADTLNRGLVNLNISGSKTNPLADIGIDFDAINRREKRMDKPSIANVAMGKAMGSGSGIGRAGPMRPSPNPMMGGPGMGMGGPPRPGMGMAMGGYGGMNMGIRQAAPMQQPMRPGSTMQGGYNANRT